MVTQNAILRLDNGFHTQTSLSVGGGLRFELTLHGRNVGRSWRDGIGPFLIQGRAAGEEHWSSLTLGKSVASNVRHRG